MIRSRFAAILRSRLFLAGAAMFLVGSGPLLFVIVREALDPAYAATKPNPIGLGCLAMLTFWPGIGLMLAGVVRELSRKDSH